MNKEFEIVYSNIEKNYNTILQNISEGYLKNLRDHLRSIKMENLYEDMKPFFTSDDFKEMRLISVKSFLENLDEYFEKGETIYINNEKLQISVLSKSTVINSNFKYHINKNDFKIGLKVLGLKIKNNLLHFPFNCELLEEHQQNSYIDKQVKAILKLYETNQKVDDEHKNLLDLNKIESFNKLKEALLFIHREIEYPSPDLKISEILIDKKKYFKNYFDNIRLEDNSMKNKEVKDLLGGDISVYEKNLTRKTSFGKVKEGLSEDVYNQIYLIISKNLDLLEPKEFINFLKLNLNFLSERRAFGIGENLSEEITNNNIKINMRDVKKYIKKQTIHLLNKYGDFDIEDLKMNLSPDEKFNNDQNPLFFEMYDFMNEIILMEKIKTQKLDMRSEVKINIDDENNSVNLKFPKYFYLDLDNNNLKFLRYLNKLFNKDNKLVYLNNEDKISFNNGYGEAIDMNIYFGEKLKYSKDDILLIVKEIFINSVSIFENEYDEYFDIVNKAEIFEKLFNSNINELFLLNKLDDKQSIKTKNKLKI